MMPHFLPAAFSAAWIMWAVVVLPLVPVTPIMVIFLAGLPKRLQLMMARAWRLFSTCTTVTPAGISSSLCWMTSPRAPAAATSSA